MQKSTQKFLVVLTGGIGSGKTTITNIFQQFNIDVIDADIIARKIVAPKTNLLKQIHQRFGDQILNKDGSLNRSILRNRIFKNSDDRQWLEQILHPEIYKVMLEDVQKAKSNYVLLVIPLFFESPPNFKIDRILLVEAPESLRKKRIQQRDRQKSDEISRIFAAQVNHTQYQADDIIQNATTLDDLKQQVIQLHQKYCQLADQKLTN